MRAYYIGKYPKWGHVIIGDNGRVLTASILNEDVRAVRKAGEVGLRVDPDFWVACETVHHADLPRLILMDAERIMGGPVPSGVAGVLTQVPIGEPD